ncbi:MAG: S41 family peptidase [Candidatus Paceibacterota bacterium]|jgi:carboxyl-terminal processing protease
MKNYKLLEYFKTRHTFTTILLVVFFFGLGIYVGFHNIPEISKVVNVSGIETAVTTEADFSPFWKVWNNINEKYPASKTTDQEKVYGAISGLVDSLNDPYSIFLKPDEAKLFEDTIQGSFGGIGIEIGMKDKILTVIAPLKDTPAYKANMKSGDKILKINDLVTSDLSVEEAIKLIRGDVGTPVTLTVFRDGETEPREIKIIRDIINVPTLDTELRKDGIFVIKLYSFSANSAELFRNALKEFSLSSTDKLLLDLRGNPGGYLESAVDMASWFLDDGKTVVIEDYGAGIKQKIYRSHGYNIFTDKLKFVILIDSGSASASEILAGAMQDYKKATLVGEQSYGKGSVQEVFDVTPDTLLKITVAKWLTPNGNSISEKGLTPDYKISLTSKDIENKNDAQLNKAIELLLK